MDKQSFIEKVSRMVGLQRLQEPTDVIEHIKHFIGVSFDAGWEYADVVTYVRCMEEIHPEMDEDIALDRMSSVRSKYAPKSPTLAKDKLTYENVKQMSFYNLEQAQLCIHDAVCEVEVTMAHEKEHGGDIECLALFDLHRSLKQSWEMVEHTLEDLRRLHPIAVKPL